MRAALWWICLAGCGRFHFDARTDAAPDAMPPDVPPPSSAILGPPLVTADPVALGPFAAGSPVVELNSPFEDDDPTLTRDELEIWFDSNRDGNNDIWTSRRASTSSPWPTPTPVVELNSTAAEEHPFVTADGLRMYFMSSRGGNRDIYIAARADRDSPWKDIATLDAFNSIEDDDMGSVSGDELTLMISSKRITGNTDDIYESRRTDPAQPWGPLMLVVELQDTNYERQPHLDDFGVVVYYEEHAFANLQYSTRATATSAWASGMPVPALDVMGYEESDPWLSPDLRRIYYSAFITQPAKDIWMATR